VYDSNVSAGSAALSAEGYGAGDFPRGGAKGTCPLGQDDRPLRLYSCDRDCEGSLSRATAQSSPAWAGALLPSRPFHRAIFSAVGLRSSSSWQVPGGWGARCEGPLFIPLGCLRPNVAADTPLSVTVLRWSVGGAGR
jgi:hypothetical protein